MAISRICLSGSSFGEPILVATTASTGMVTIHTGTTISGTYDEVWITAANVGTAAHTVYLAIASSTCLTGANVSPLTSAEPLLLLAGGPLRGSTVAAPTIAAYATTSAAIVLYGHVNRMAT